MKIVKIKRSKFNLSFKMKYNIFVNLFTKQNKKIIDLNSKIRPK